VNKEGLKSKETPSPKTGYFYYYLPYSRLAVRDNKLETVEENAQQSGPSALQVL